MGGVLWSADVKRVLVALGLATDTSPLSKTLILACQLVRLLMVAWVVMIVVISTLIYWYDKEQLLRNYAAFSGLTVEPISTLQRATAYLVRVIAYVLKAMLVIKVWRLFGHYIAGNIFDRKAVSTFRQAAGLAVAVYVSELVGRHIVLAILTSGHFAFMFWRSDVRYIVMVLFLLVQAQVFSEGAAIADENRQIV